MRFRRHQGGDDPASAGGGIAQPVVSRRALIGAAATVPALAASPSLAAGANDRRAVAPRADAQLDFGCSGDGRADDSAPMLAFFRHCIETGAEGFIPAGTYRIAWGVLLFRSGGRDRPWPVIRTAGSDFVILKGIGTTDAPMIEINNRTADGRVTTITNDKVWAGGELGGFTVVPERRQHGATNRHALRLSGIQQLTVGPIVAADLQGSALHIPRETTRDVTPSNPDPFHVYACRFAYVAALRCDGWAVLNENGVGLTHCRFDAVRAISTIGGGFFGVGGGNVVGALSTGSCKGWALDDGGQESEIGAATFLLETAEIDDCEFGIRLNHIHQSDIARARIVHRLDYAGRTDGMYPRTALSLGGGRNPRVTDIRIDVEHRFDNHHPDRAGILVDFNDNAGTLVNVDIDLSLRGGGIEDNRIVHRMGSSNQARIRRDGRVIVDSLPRRVASAAADGMTVLPNTGFGTAGSILAFRRKRFDSSDDYDVDRQAFVVPYTGKLWVMLTVPLDVPVGTVIRLAILLRRNGEMSMPTMRRFTHAGIGVHHYQLVQIIDVLAGDVIHAAGDQNGPRPIETSPLFSMDESLFQALML